MALGDRRREKLAHHIATAFTSSIAKRADNQWYLMEALQLSNNPAINWPDTATSSRILRDLWLFTSCPDALSPSDAELKALARIHAEAEPLMADFFMRATSNNLPDSLHARPQLMPAKEARKIMAQLSPGERARIHRAFYRGQLLNCVLAPRTSPFGQLVANALKAWCLWATWQPWEVQEIMTLHAYIRHQHELLLETVSGDFIHRLQAIASPDGPSITGDWLRTGANPPAPYATCVAVSSLNNNEPQIHVYTEQQASRGAATLTRFLAQNNTGRRTLVRGNYHALVWPLGLDSPETYNHWSTQIANLSLFSCGDTIARTLWDRHGGVFHAKSTAPLDQPTPGWSRYPMAVPDAPKRDGFVYEHSLLTGLVFWDVGRLEDLQRRVRACVGEGAATWLGFRRPDERPRPEGRGVAWWFTQLPQPVPLVEGAELEGLRAEFGCLCDEAEHHGTE